ncbi:MAG: DUF721 domain-containing protein [Candidatus Caldatribacterium sp.]|nr:DUF721 domain-containing protein [Candidatus Caldatribacterium sp.]
MRKPLPIGEIVAEYLKKSGLFPKVQVYQVMERFGEWFPDLSSLCTPAKVSRNVLFLEVEDPLYLCEVESRVDEVLSFFRNQGIPIEAVKVRVRLR